MTRRFAPILLALATPLLHADPVVKITFPPAGTRIQTSNRTFVIGSVQPPETPLAVNGQTVTPWRTGGFLYMARVAPGTNTLEIQAGDTRHPHTFTVLPTAPTSWDGLSLRAVHPLRPLGVYTGETVRLACLAPTGQTVFAALGERIAPLPPAAGNPTTYAAPVSFDADAENVPLVFFSDKLGEVTAGTLTARADWPALCVTGLLFEARVRSEPGDGDTLGFLPPGHRIGGAGFVGTQTRLWVDGTMRFIDSRCVVDDTRPPLPPRTLPLPDVTAGFGPHPPTNRTLSDLLIVLDPGHGGPSSGALGPTGLTEKDANLRQAFVVRDRLNAAGVRVLMTRETDIDIGLYDRAQMAYAAKAHAFISIHYNSCAPSANPQERRHISTYAWNDIGLRLAKALHPHLAAATPIPDEGVRTASFAVCRNPAVPSVLLELDFISSPEGEDALVQPAQQQRVAEAILNGLRDWLKPAAD